MITHLQRFDKGLTKKYAAIFIAASVCAFCQALNIRRSERNMRVSTHISTPV